MAFTQTEEDRDIWVNCTREYAVSAVGGTQGANDHAWRLGLPARERSWRDGEDIDTRNNSGGEYSGDIGTHF
jgi:hypothetical protein